jgi:hypothetical protein
MSDTPLTEIQLHQPGDKPHLFQKGHPRYGGRRKGSRNRFGGDLRAGSARIRQADVQVKASNRFAWNGSPQTRQNLDFTAICDR